MDLDKPLSTNELAGPINPPEVSAPLPPGITRFCDVAKMARLTQDYWSIVFQVLS